MGIAFSRCRDRLSELPDHIIDIILSYLSSPEEIVQTRLLSKRWRRIPYSSIRTLSFPQRTNRIKFESYVDRVMKGLLENKVTINIFEVYVVRGYGYNSMVHRWVKMAMDSSVEEIRLYAVDEGCISIPASVFVSRTLKSLTVSGMRAEFPKELLSIRISLPCLKRLDLRHTDVKEDLLRYVISSCPNLEELLLEDVVWLKALNLLGVMNNLRSLTIRSSSEFDPTLEAFLREAIPNLPVLETLHLQASLIKLEIRSRSLQVIYFLAPGKSPEVIDIDTPNLCRLQYIGKDPPSGFGPRRSPGRWEASTYWYSYDDHVRSPWFVKLREMLSKPFPFQLLRITCQSPYTTVKEMTPEDFKDPNLLYRVAEIDHLMLNIKASNPASFSASVRRLFWNCRPKLLTLVIQKIDLEHVKLFCKELKAAVPGCCSDSSRFKCWRHYLKHVQEISYRETGNLPEARVDLCLELDWGCD